MFSYGIAFNTAYVIKKYHSGSICAGVTVVLIVYHVSLDVLVDIVLVLCYHCILIKKHV